MLGNTLTATYKSNYPKVVVNKVTGLPEIDPVTGQTKVRDIFVYRITGSPEDLKAYTDSVGNNLVTDDDGAPLYFTVTPSPTDVCKMYQTKTGKNAGQFNLDMSEFRKDRAIVAMAGGNMGQSIADAKASKYVTLPSALNARLTNLVAAQTTESAGDMDEQ